MSNITLYMSETIDIMYWLVQGSG